jgi:hypothetical protein
MFANPEVSSFIDKLIGGATPHGGAPPPTQGYRGALAKALLGDVTQPSIMGGFSAPPIGLTGGGVTPPLPTQGVNRGLGSQELTPLGSSSGSRSGGSGIGAGLGKLGSGIESAMKAIAEKRAAAAQFQAELASHGVTMPSTIGGGGASPVERALAADGAPGAATPASPAFSPIGAASETPIFAQPGSDTGLVGGSIGAAGSLPTFAAGTPGAGETVTVPQFLTGIKAEEGTPYSGQSHTGAIGAYGLTGDFIKQWAPGAGLPTDRASYKNSPDLQDQLARYAAGQMYNKFGSWEPVANAWLTGSPTATVSAPGNMTPAAYVAGVMKAAQQAPSQPTTGEAAYAASSPSTDQSKSEFALDQQGTPRMSAANGSQGQQPVVPGQTDPHQRGFDPSSVPFINTPLPGEQPPLLNNGQPGIYSMPGQQGMNDNGNAQIMLAGLSDRQRQMAMPTGPGGLRGGDFVTGTPPPFSGGIDPSMEIRPPSGDMPLSPSQQVDAGGSQGVNNALQMNALAMALSQPALPPIDPGLFGGGFGGGFGLFG